jgi:hypothetical protein
MLPLRPITDPSTRQVRRPHTSFRQFDPPSARKRPFFTAGNAIVVIVVLLFALYATGNFPQLDAFFRGLHSNLRSHNDVIVGTILQYGPFLFFAALLLAAVWFAFLRPSSSEFETAGVAHGHNVAARRAQPRRVRREQDPPSVVRPRRLHSHHSGRHYPQKRTR